VQPMMVDVSGSQFEFDNPMPLISPMSQVDAGAELADDVEIGPFCHIGAEVRLGPGNRLLSHVCITGRTTVGPSNTFYPHCVIGAAPQDLKYRGGITRVEIGENNTIREAVTIHLGTEKGGGVTSIGDHNLLMVNVHLGHDVRLGSRCILANNVMVAGHCVIGNHVNMAGIVGLNHFVTVGDYAYLAGAARIHHDVPPFVRVSDDDKIRALNVVGLQRAGFSEDDIAALEDATKRLFKSKEKPLAATMSEFETMNGVNPQVKKMIEFLRRRTAGKHGRALQP